MRRARSRDEAYVCACVCVCCAPKQVSKGCTNQRVQGMRTCSVEVQASRSPDLSSRASVRQRSGPASFGTGRDVGWVSPHTPQPTHLSHSLPKCYARTHHTRTHGTFPNTRARSLSMMRDRGGAPMGATQRAHVLRHPPTTRVQSNGVNAKPGCDTSTSTTTTLSNFTSLIILQL
jgi:hypothetical protein